MPYLLGSPLLDAGADQLQDASGNDLAEQDWDFSALTATLSNQQSETLSRIGEPQSTLFDYAASTNGFAVSIPGILAAVLDALGIIQAVQDLLGVKDESERTVFQWLLTIWNQVSDYSNAEDTIPQQAQSNVQAILDSINALGEGGGGVGGGGDELARIPMWGDFYYAPAWPGTNPSATVVDGAPMLGGESRLEYLARVAPDLTWGTYHNGDGLVSAPLTEEGGGARIVFRYTEDEWIAKGGGARGGGGNPGSPDNQEILDAIDALRGGEATVTGAAQNGLDAIAAAESAEAAVTAARGGEETLQSIHDDIAALQFPEPPTAAAIADAVWAELLGETAAGTLLQQAAAIQLDLTDVLDAIDALRGGEATVQQVKNAVDALVIPDVPTAVEVATAVWAHLTNGQNAAYQLNAAANHPSVPTASDNAAAVWAYVISAVTASQRLVDAGKTYPPVWPGYANVSFGSTLPVTNSGEYEVVCDGVLISVVSTSRIYSQMIVGGNILYRGIGRIAFVTDNGQMEPWQPIPSNECVMCPKACRRAAGFVIGFYATVQAAVTPWVSTV